MAASAPREYNSEYERLVLTSGHPAKTTFMTLDDPPYIAANDYPWLANRREELIVVAFLVAVVAYCSTVYVGIYAVTYPIRLTVSYSWDLIFVSMLALTLRGRILPRLPSRKAIAAMPPAEQEAAQRTRKEAARAYTKLRNFSLVLCAAGALMRWYQGWGDVRSLMA